MLDQDIKLFSSGLKERDVVEALCPQESLPLSKSIFMHRFSLALRQGFDCSFYSSKDQIRLPSDFKWNDSENGVYVESDHESSDFGSSSGAEED